MHRTVHTLTIVALLLSIPAATATADPQQVVERYFAAYARGDVDALLDLYSDQAVFHDVSQRHEVSGREELKVFLDQLVALHETMGSEPKRRAASGDLVVVEHEYVGTLSGEALGRSLGKDGCPDIEYRLPVTSWYEIRDGRILRHTDFIDLATLQELQRQALAASAGS